MKKIIYKVLSYLVVLTIFFFLAKGLVDYWQKLEEYTFSFNYFYLGLSFLFVIPGIIIQAFIWNAILKILEPDKKLSNFKALKFFVYSWLGRYIPGKAWMYMARVHFGIKEGLSKKRLTLSVIYEIILSIASAFLISIFLLVFTVGSDFLGLMPDLNIFFVLLVIVLGLVFVHPSIFGFFFNLLLKILKQEVLFDRYLGYFSVVKIIVYYFFSYIINGIGFFFLVKSIANLPFYDIIGIVGFFNLASVLGIVAIFTPSGLGVREGFLVVFLKIYFPLSIAIVISLIGRIWMTLAELIILSSVYIYDKLKRI